MDMFNMINNVKLRKKTEKSSRPKTWCVPTTHADLHPYIHERSRQAMYGDMYTEEKYGVNNGITGMMQNSYNNIRYANSVIINSSMSNIVSPKKCYQRDDDNNNLIRCGCTEAKNMTNRCNCADKFSRKALRLTKTRSLHLDHKKNTTKSFCRSILRRSCELLKAQGFDYNLKDDNSEVSPAYPKRSKSCKREPLSDGVTLKGGPHTGDENIFDTENIKYQGEPITTEEAITRINGFANSVELNVTRFVPWSKRENLMQVTENVPSETFRRRGSRTYSSLRSTPVRIPLKASDVSFKNNHSFKITRQCESIHCKSINRENMIHKRSSMSSLSRNNSVKIRAKKHNRDDVPKRLSYNPTSDRTRTMNNYSDFNTHTQTTLQSKTMNMTNATNFFMRYQDKPREENISALPISCCDCSKFTHINDVFEYILNMYRTKLTNKTCKQLFYIRSRLSTKGRLNETMCDGCFGCEHEHTGT